LAQIKQAENVSAKENELALLQSELDELKLDFGRKQGELQKICGELAREREESRRRENIMQLESSRMEEELRERDELLKGFFNFLNIYQRAVIFNFLVRVHYYF